MNHIKINQILLSYFYSRILMPRMDDFYFKIDELAQGIPIAELSRAFSAQADLVLWDQVLSERTKLINQIETAIDKGVNFTFPGEENYPTSMFNMTDVPFFLTYVGTPVWKKMLGLAVVGSREPSQLSEVWCEQELPPVLLNLPLMFVSGGARGVDQIAHRICLRNDRPTVAFLPSGLFEIYPSEFSSWSESIIKGGGAVVSEFSPQVKMKKYFFQRRNRLIAGLSVATLLIEARRKSGTLITARQTLDQGKTLFVLPSHPLDTGNMGGLDLLSEGATPIRDAKDLTICLHSEISSYQARNAHLVMNMNSYH
jgi:DNA processing protein